MLESQVLVCSLHSFLYVGSPTVFIRRVLNSEAASIWLVTRKYVWLNVLYQCCLVQISALHLFSHVFTEECLTICYTFIHSYTCFEQI
jgi:hypothetical protein